MTKAAKDAKIARHPLGILGKVANPNLATLPNKVGNLAK
jgi:hypothetical protein